MFSYKKKYELEPTHREATIGLEVITRILTTVLLWKSSIEDEYGKKGLFASRATPDTLATRLSPFVTSCGDLCECHLDDRWRRVLARTGGTATAAPDRDFEWTVAP